MDQGGILPGWDWNGGQSILRVLSGLLILLGTGIKAKGKGGQDEEEVGSSSHDEKIVKLSKVRQNRKAV